MRRAPRSCWTAGRASWRPTPARCASLAHSLARRCLPSSWACWVLGLPRRKARQLCRTAPWLTCTLPCALLPPQLLDRLASEAAQALGMNGVPDEEEAKSLLFKATADYLFHHGDQ